MLSEKVIEQLTERLVKIVEETNIEILKEIGKSVKKIGTLSPVKAQELVQILKYGGSYDKIVKKIKELTKLSEKEIDKIFKEVAKTNQEFAKQFYQYKGIDYIPYEQNWELQRQVNALAEITKDEFRNITKTLGYARRKANGKIEYTELSKVYQDILDKAIINTGQGKETFDSAMFKSLKEIGESGLKIMVYPDGYNQRLDTAVRRNMMDGIRNLHNVIQKQLGEEFGADGVEITVHENPAPDHAEVQGKQFSNEEFEKFQNDEEATSYDGTVFPPEIDGKDRRSISEYNCYHYTFSIVLGVNKPQYSKEQLKQINTRNEKGFDFEGKHYSMYQGTQLQRNIEIAIRKNKDLQIFGRSSDNEELIRKSQEQITILTRKYNQLCQASGLSSKADRLRVSGYRRIAIKNEQ